MWYHLLHGWARIMWGGGACEHRGNTWGRSTRDSKVTGGRVRRPDCMGPEPPSLFVLLVLLNPMSKVNTPKVLLPFTHVHSMLEALKGSYHWNYNHALGRTDLWLDNCEGHRSRQLLGKCWFTNWPLHSWQTRTNHRKGQTTPDW